jgi:hypothetical protein
MTTSPTTLQEVDAQLSEQALAVANLRAAVEVLFQCITQLQAELHVIPHARQRRRSMRAALMAEED